tara:strand:+ start:90508 stop:91305 length:798 start_codon:yes stop_codon:yes gene_type:complete
MTIRICIAGVTGWTGSAVTRAILSSGDYELVGAIARQTVGQDVGELLGMAANGITVVSELGDELAANTDVLVDFTSHETVKRRAISALNKGVRVVIGTSGLVSADYDEIEQVAESCQSGVVAAGNFSITAALAKHFSLLATRHLPSWEIIDYASASKKDAPSGTVRELAEAMGVVAQNHLEVPLEETHGERTARGASIGGSQVHSIRLPGHVLGFDVNFGLPNERLSIRHEAGSGAEPYVQGTLVAVQKVMQIEGLVRGLDKLLF